VLSQNCKKRLLASSCPSVYPSAWNNSSTTGRILIKLDILAFFRRSVEKIQVSLKSNKNNGCLYMKTFSNLWQYLAKLFLERKMFSIKHVEEMKTHILYSIFFKSCRLWDNVEKYGGTRWATNHITIWRIRVACWICTATCTQAHAHAHALGRTQTHKYGIFIAFTRQQWFANAPQCYVIRILCVLLFMLWLIPAPSPIFCKFLTPL
jgi:hypothetical protein